MVSKWKKPLSGDSSISNFFAEKLEADTEKQIKAVVILT